MADKWSQRVAHGDQMAHEENRESTSMFDRFCDEISLPTARYIASGYNTKVRILTAVVILFMCGMTIYQVYDRVSYYLSTPVNVVVTEAEQSNELMPAIVMCPSGQFRPHLFDVGREKFLEDLIQMELQRDNISTYFIKNNISLTDDDFHSLYSELLAIGRSIVQANSTELTKILDQLDQKSASLANVLPFISSLLQTEEPTLNGQISLPNFTADFNAIRFTDFRNQNKIYSNPLYPCLTLKRNYVWNETVAKIFKCRLIAWSNFDNPSGGLLGQLKNYHQFAAFVEQARTQMEDVMLDCQWLGNKCNFTEVWTPQGKCFRILPQSVDNWLFTDLGSSYAVNILIDTLNNEFPNKRSKVFLYSSNETEFAQVSGGIDIKPGKATEISISQIRKQIRAPKNCGSFKLAHFQTYSNEKCVWEMRTRKIAEKCGCLSDSTPHYWTEVQKTKLDNRYEPALNYCSFARSLFCSRKEQDINYVCPENCEENVYEIDMSVMSVDGKEVFTRLPPKFDEKANRAMQLLSAYDEYRLASGSDQLDLLLDEIFGALMNLLSMFWWKSDVDPFYRIWFEGATVGGWSEIGTFGGYFLTGNGTSRPCHQFSPSLLELPQYRYDAYNSVLNNTLQQYYDMHNSWMNDYLNEVLSPFVEKVTADADLLKNNSDKDARIKFLVLNKLSMCFDLFLMCLRGAETRQEKGGICFLTEANNRNGTAYNIADRDGYLNQLGSDSTLADDWLPKCIIEMKSAVSNLKVPWNKRFKDQMLGLADSNNETKTSTWQQPLSILLSWIRGEVDFAHSFKIPYTFTVNSRSIDVATVSLGYPPDSPDREKLRMILVNISSALMASKQSLDGLNSILNTIKFDEEYYWKRDYASLLYNNFENESSLMELTKCMDNYVDVFDRHLKSGRVFGLSTDGTYTKWYSAFINLIDNILVAYQQGNGYHEASLAEVNIYFRSFRQRIIEEQESYTIWSLLSDMGGALGLWLGGTALTVYELIVISMSSKNDKVIESERKKQREEAWKRNMPPSQYMQKTLANSAISKIRTEVVK